MTNNIFQKTRNAQIPGFDEIVNLAKDITSHTKLLDLMREAVFVKEKYFSDKVDLCSLINAKSGKCDQDCAFCSQSGFHNTGCTEYELVSKDQVLEKARLAKKHNASHFCIVTSGGELSGEEFENVLDYIKAVKQQTGLDVDCSLGGLTAERARALKNAGIARYNHNLETSQSYYPNICTTHAHSDRVDTVKKIKSADIGICSGGIIGMGESMNDRIQLAFGLKDLDPYCVPINILNPCKGTPLENLDPITPFEILKTIALFRLILQKSIIKIAGGREHNLRDLQALALLAGANGFIIGGYLTTKGRSPQDDLQMIEDLGLKIKDC